MEIRPVGATKMHADRRAERGRKRKKIRKTKIFNFNKQGTDIIGENKIKKKKKKVIT
jgi:hypothetical protein